MSDREYAMTVAGILIGVMLFVLFMVWSFASKNLPPVGDVDSPVTQPPVFSYIRSEPNIGDFIVVDNETGCEYLLMRTNAVYPRMNADGKQICRQVTQ